MLWRDELLQHLSSDVLQKHMCNYLLQEGDRSERHSTGAGQSHQSSRGRNNSVQRFISGEQTIGLICSLREKLCLQSE